MWLRLRPRSAVHGPSAPRPIPPCFPTSWTSGSPLRDSQCWLHPLHRARVHHTAHRIVYHSLAQQPKKGAQEVSAQDMICRAADSVHSEPRWNCSVSSIGCPHLLIWKTENYHVFSPFLALEYHIQIEMFLIHFAAWYVIGEKLSDVRKQTLTSAKSCAPKLCESSQATFIMDSLSTTWPFLGSCSCLLTPRIVSSPQFMENCNFSCSHACYIFIYKLKLMI